MITHYKTPGINIMLSRDSCQIYLAKVLLEGCEDLTTNNNFEIF